MQQLEMLAYETKPTPEQRQVVYQVGNLDSLSAFGLYSGKDSGEEYRKYVDETIMEDDHAPFGEHLNYRVWLNLKGPKEGRNREITNVHISLSAPSGGSGYLNGKT